MQMNRIYHALQTLLLCLFLFSMAENRSLKRRHSTESQVHLVQEADNFCRRVNEDVTILCADFKYDIIKAVRKQIDNLLDADDNAVDYEMEKKRGTQGPYDFGQGTSQKSMDRTDVKNKTSVLVENNHDLHMSNEIPMDSTDGMDDENVPLATLKRTMVETSPPIIPVKKRVLKDLFQKRVKESVTNLSMIPIASNGKDGHDGKTVEVTTADKEDKLVLCDHSVVLFVGEANEKVRKDVENSLILAQLNADRRLAEFKQKSGSTVFVAEGIKTWSNTFQETFRHMGWSDIGFQVTEATASGKDLSIDKLLMGVIEAVGNEEEKSKFKKAMSVLKGLPQDDDRLQLFKRRSVGKDLVQFQVHMVFIDKRGAATMKTTCIGISTQEKVTDILWFRWNDSSTQVFNTEHTMILGAQSFENIRDVIEKRILKINETYINDIPF